MFCLLMSTRRTGTITSVSWKWFNNYFITIFLLIRKACLQSAVI